MKINLGHFRLQIVWRMIGLSTIPFLVLAAYPGTIFIPSLICASLMLIYLVASMIRLVERSNRELSRFLDSIRYQDFSLSSGADHLGASFGDLQRAFAEVISAFHRSRAEKEEQYRYLQTIIQHIGIGLISFSADGQVDLINKAAQRLLQFPRLKNVRDLHQYSPELVSELFKIKPGEKSLLRISHPENPLQLILSATEFRIRENRFTLVSLQDIRGELEERELEAWQNLIRVLTHEIMNSMTPISSLSSTANSLLDSLPSADTSEETVQDIREALQTIQKRSQGLMEFVRAYRHLTLIPRPNFQILPLKELFARIQTLTEHKLQPLGIELKTEVDPPSLELTADPALIEQVIINVLFNAADAVQGCHHPLIEMTAGLDSNSRVILVIRDNGRGIEPEALGKVFIPFFTTKKTGSGIGLSFSRQVMRLHHGAIALQSQPEKGTVVTLRF